MKEILLRIKYPKLFLLILTFLLAYLVFIGRNLLPFYDKLLSLGYVGVFLVGVFYTYGFTSAPATAILLLFAKEQNILLSSIIGGFGALLGDLIVFNFIRHSFYDEIEKLSKEKIFVHINNLIPDVIKRHLFRKYTVVLIAAFIIASPLPDEIGVSILAAFTDIKIRVFSIVSFLLNTLGIFSILIIGDLV